MVDYTSDVDKINSDLKVLSMTNPFADRYVSMIFEGFDRTKTAEAVLVAALDEINRLQEELIKQKERSTPCQHNQQISK